MRFLNRWADATLQAKLAYLETELAKLRSLNRVQQAELDSLAGVVARDRARVQAETAVFARQTAEGRATG
jgi:hypothetical protein